MFRDNLSIRINTSKSEEEVYNLVEDALEDLGRTSISNSGTIRISDSKFNGFGFVTEIDGRIVKRDDYYNLDLDFNSKPEILSWIIAICFFPIGAAIFVLPYNAKSEINKKANRILNDLKYDLEKKDDMV